MGWSEAWRLYLILARDPTSAVAAAQAGWDYSLSREGMALMDLYDLMHAANSKHGARIKPYPRPWPDVDKTVLGGKKTRLSQDEVRALLASRAPGAAPSKKPRARDARGRFVKST